MERIEFEKKYLSCNFFWLTDHMQSYELQNILIEFGYKNPIGTESIIEMHKGFNKIATFKPDEQRSYKYFQKVDIYNPSYSYGTAVDYGLFIKDYRNLK